VKNQQSTAAASHYEVLTCEHQLCNYYATYVYDISRLATTNPSHQQKFIMSLIFHNQDICS